MVCGMNARTVRKGGDMIKFERGWQWALSIVILYAFFRFVESIYVYNVLLPENPVDAHSATNLVASSFNIYRDFVTIITGLLTLIIGATGIGAYLSFKKFRAEEQKVLDSLEQEKEKIIDRRNQLDMFLKIEEARNNLEYEWGFISAIQLYDKAEEKYNSHYLLYALRGNAYYFAAKRSIGLSDGRETLYLDKARCDFELAVEKNKNSMLAVYGLGQVLFQQALMSREKKEFSGIDWDELPPVGKECLDDTGSEQLKKLKLKRGGDYLGADAKVVKKSISYTQDAIYKGYDDVVGDYTLATMYEAIDNVDLSYAHYKRAYEKGHLPAGYQYCYLWLRKNNIKELNEDIKSIILILKRVSVEADDFSNAAHALIVFVSVNISNLQENIGSDYRHVDKFTIENLFYMDKV